jgi:hypothetical protein
MCQGHRHRIRKGDAEVDVVKTIEDVDKDGEAINSNGM